MFQAQLWDMGGGARHNSQLSTLQKPKSKEEHVITVQESLGAWTGHSVLGMRKQIWTRLAGELYQHLVNLRITQRGNNNAKQTR